MAQIFVKKCHRFLQCFQIFPVVSYLFVELTTTSTVALENAQLAAHVISCASIGNYQSCLSRLASTRVASVSCDFVAASGLVFLDVR